jgi:Tfp pilus assembly protein PilF/4-amino-4-deoxy-L-arabinose transferase-like glycosyltransferase
MLRFIRFRVFVAFITGTREAVPGFTEERRGHRLLFVKPRPKPGKGTPTRVWLLLAVLALGLGLRVANLIDVSDSPFFTHPVIDGQAYDRWALAIIGRAEGPQVKAAANGPFYQDPLYPYFLALIYSVFGHSYWAVYVVQLALALVFLLLVYDTARRLFDRRAGIMAAAMAALYKPFIFYESQIEKTALAVFLTALFLWLLARSLRPGHSPGPRHSSFLLRHSPLLWPLATGLALGLTALTRANTLLFAPLLPLALALKPQATSHRLRMGAAAFSVIGVLLVIAPVSIRNSILAREFVLTTTQAGQNLYIGNSPYNTTGQYQAPPWVRPTPEYEQSDFAEYANKTAGKTLSYSGVSSFYTRAALNWATSHGSDFAKLLWRKTVLYFNNFEVPDNQDLYFFARYSWVLRLPLLSFGIVFGLGLAAMILTARGLGRLSMAIFFFGYAVSVVVFFVFSRYRIPALPALLPFAGAMLPWLADSYRARSSPHVAGRSSSIVGRNGPSRTDHRSSFPARLAGGLTLMLATYALTLYPVYRGTGETEAAQCLSNLATVLYHEGDTAQAIRTYEEALANQPGHSDASRNLGIIMLGRGNTDRAFQLLSAAARSEPSNPSNHLFLGRIYERRGQLETARLEFSKAVALAPGRVEVRFELARTLQQLDRYPQALAQYDTMIQLAPDNASVRHNYAACLYSVGRLDDARIQLEAARGLGGTVNPKLDSLLRTGRNPAR